jgi:HTH-type transcriptional regulator, transcriptional repressor of NAD biosynthesis genes
MSKAYATGLVVGKFAPLHSGHVLVVERALSLCERVVVISYSNPELPGYEPERREAWLKTCFPGVIVLVVTPERLACWLVGAVPAIPANDASDFAQRDFVAMLCTRVLGLRIDAVFTSEAYGEGFAAHLGRRLGEPDLAPVLVHHVMVDCERRAVPISGTKLRANLWRHWSYLPPPVAHSLVRRIAILGGESSGKTTLAASLGAEFGTEWVPEYGRELWEAKEGALAYEDMVAIAREQIRREEDAARLGRAFVFCDTSPLTTLFYSLEMFGRADPELVRAAQRSYSIVLLCAPDFPFVQDGTRRDGAFRQQQHAWYEAQLATRGVRYAIARGSLADRVHFVRQLLDHTDP